MISCVVLVENEGPKTLEIYIYIYICIFLIRTFTCAIVSSTRRTRFGNIFASENLPFPKNTHISHVFGPSLSRTKLMKLIRWPVLLDPPTHADANVRIIRGARERVEGS